jgi:radical SAM-linked protein
LALGIGGENGVSDGGKVGYYARRIAALIASNTVRGLNVPPTAEVVLEATLLPTGEVVDVRFNVEISTDEIAARLKDSLPPDIQVTSVESVDERGPALQTQVLSAEYNVLLTEPVDGFDLKRKVQELMASESLPRERRGKFYDLRPLIERLDVIEEVNGKVGLNMVLSARDGATGRPEEVLNALDIEPEYTRVERTRLIFQD